jgi:hypothetical protein
MSMGERYFSLKREDQWFQEKSQSVCHSPHHEVSIPVKNIEEKLIKVFHH